MSFKVNKLIVGKGRTTGNEKDQTWTRLFYEIEVSIEDERQLELAKESIETLLDTWLKGEVINKPQPKSASVDLPGVDLSKLPWVSYKTKTEAAKNEAGWIFSNTKGAEALVATLKSKDGKVRVGNFDYTLQGDQKQFISRKPLKSKGKGD